MNIIKWIKENKKLVYIFIGFTLVMAIACVLLYYPMIDFFKDPMVVKKQLMDTGFLGQCIVTLAMTLQVVFVFLPGEIIEILAGFMYGPIGGMCICLLGAALGSCIIYLFVQKLGLRFIDKLLGKGKIDQVSFLKKQHNLDILLFIIFLIPGTPKDIITYFMPLTSMSLSRFLCITTIARIPSVITSTISGTALGLAQYDVMIAVLAVTAIVSIIGLYLYKHKVSKVIL